MWGCPEHYKMVPSELMTRIRATWQPGAEAQPRAYNAVLSELGSWIIEHFDGMKDRHDPVDGLG